MAGGGAASSMQQFMIIACSVSTQRDRERSANLLESCGEMRRLLDRECEGQVRGARGASKGRVRGEWGASERGE